MPTVLIIDSDAEVAKELSQALAQRGVKTDVTGDGAEGLKMARAARPDLIVLCVELSRVSGYSICNKLKKDADLSQIPLILASSQATEETFEQHKKLKTRAEQYLRKPFAMGQIHGLIGQYVDMQAGEAEVDDALDVSIDDVDIDTGEGNDLEFGATIDPHPAPAAAPSIFGGSAEEPMVKTAITELPAFTDGIAAGQPVQTEPSRPSKPALEAVAREPASDRGKAEVTRLRQKVLQLEQTLQQKELEFNDRLLQESTRSRESVELKKRLSQVEREIAKHQQAAERAEAKANEGNQGLEAAKEEVRAAQQERDELSEKVAQLVTKVKSLAKERDELRAAAEKMRAEQQAAQQEVEQAAKLRGKAKKAVDIAMQLLEETGLFH